MAFEVVGGIASGIYGRKIERDLGMPSPIETVTNMLFSCIGITLGMYFAGLILSLVLGYRDGFPAAEICIIISIVMAIAFFVSSFATGIKWFRWVAFGWWFAMVVFIINPFEEKDTMLVIALLDFILLALPGYKLIAITKQASA